MRVVVGVVGLFVLVWGYGVAVQVGRDDFGTLVITGTSREDAFKQLGMGHVEDRLFQMFLRYAASNGRLTEFLPFTEDNLEADKLVRATMYTEEELNVQWNDVLNDDARLVYGNYVKGVEKALKDVKNPPWEFTQLGVPWPLPKDMFDLNSCLRYALFTMRRLTNGWDPLVQLENAQLLSALQKALGIDGGNAAFHDLVTEIGEFPLENIVIADKGETTTTNLKKSRHQRLPAPALQDHSVEHALRSRRVARHLEAMGAVSHDGSWAIVTKGAFNTTMAQFGPQDDNFFPTTFYEAFMDVDGVSVHYFSEVGMPLNQFYFLNRDFVLGRNRGYGYCNDYLQENVGRTFLFATNKMQLRNGTVISYPLYRSHSGGFVVSRNESTALTLRTPFLGTEIRGLNQLSSVFFCRSLEQFVSTMFGAEYQSPILHSHLQMADASHVGAALNGLLTALPPAFDRRFALAAPGLNDSLPEYQILQPRWELDAKQQYFSWNAPFDREVPWTADYLYGGWWRHEWIARFFEKHPIPTWRDLLSLPAYMAAANALQLSGNGDHDQFARHMWSSLRPLVEDPALRGLLDSFHGAAFEDTQANDYSDGYVLANAWLWKMIEATFVPKLGRNVPGFELPAAFPLPATHPRRRFASIMVLLVQQQIVNSSLLLHYDWLDGQSFSSLASSSLTDAVSALGPRPWGVGLRPNATMTGLAGVLGVVGTLPTAQLPSANVMIELTSCGATRLVSSIPFGQSGLVSAGRVFAQHTLDQWPLYSTYAFKSSSLSFGSTSVCVTNEANRILLYVGVAVLATVVVVVLGVLIVWAVKRARARRSSASYQSLR